MLASLNHPGIAQIYGIEEANDTRALVLELVDGESLGQRVARGAIPLDDALAIARDIADALEAAHHAGIIHRDLKPANVMLTWDGRVKVLDFGLAKAVDPATAASELSVSSTITSPAVTTGIGAIVGTAAYMAPEQARGRPADKRSDVWAFGCLLFEMLAGVRAFEGNQVPDTLAVILQGEPGWTRLPADAPAAVVALLRRCLRKDTRERLQCIGDVRIAINECLAGTTSFAAMPVRASSRMPWFVSAVAAAAAVVIGMVAWSWPRPPALSPPVTRFTIGISNGLYLAATDQPALALSDDGGQLAYVAGAEGVAQQIYVRAMDRADPVPVAGTEGAVLPFFSPDGQWLGFFADGKLKKVSTKGGAPQVLADVAAPQGASWTGHTIVFASDLSVLLQVRDDGGTPQAMSRFDPGDIAHAFPRFLPDGKSVLFSTVPSTTAPGLAAQRSDSGVRRTLLDGQDGLLPAYTSSGHLIFAQAGSLMAARFDISRLTVQDVASPVVQGIFAVGRTPQFAVSPSGTLAYIPQGAHPPERAMRLVWVDRDGTENLWPAPPRLYNQPRLSPDGRQVAVDVIDRDNQIEIAVVLNWSEELRRRDQQPR